MESCEKELILLLLFYIPALIYEIINPNTIWHFWHYLIFVLPILLIKSRFLHLCFEKTTGMKISKLFFPVVLVIIISTTVIILKNIHKVNMGFSQVVKIGEFYNTRNLSLIFRTLSSRLGIIPEKLFESIYIEGDSPGSKNFSNSHFRANPIWNKLMINLKSVYISYPVDTDREKTLSSRISWWNQWNFFLKTRLLK